MPQARDPRRALARHARAAHRGDYEKNQFDKESPARAEAAVDRVIGQMSAMVGLNLVLLDASGIANFNAKHTLWPTWRRLSQRLTDEVGEHR